MRLPGDESGALIETQDTAGSPQPPQSKAVVSGPAVSSGGTSVHPVRFNRVDINFFRALDVPILAGRGFEPADVPSAGGGPAEGPESGAVVVNQSFALRIFGGDALGKRIRYSGRSKSPTTPDSEPGRWYQVVGIVRDFPAGVSPAMNDSQQKVYHPVAAGQVQPVSLALRMRGGDPSAFAPRLAEVAASVDPDIHVRDIVRLDEALHKEQWIRRFEAAVVGGVALSVLLLSAAGSYALMSFTVSQRRKEIGIRMALGADRKRIVAGIFSRAFAQLAVGAALGAGCAALLERASGGDLMRGNAPVVLAVVALLMMAVGTLAALGPARRSLRIQPTEALREQ
jgi:hypothetical protein